MVSPSLEIAALRRRIQQIVARNVASHGFYPSELYLGQKESDTVKIDLGSGSKYEVRDEGVFYLGLRLHEVVDKSHVGVGNGE